MLAPLLVSFVWIVQSVSLAWVVRPTGITEDVSFTTKADDSEATLGIGQTVTVLTVETRVNETSIPVPGVYGRKFTNVGAGLTWGGWKWRAEQYMKWLNQAARKNPDGVVVVADYTDVIFGGCSDDDFLELYWGIVNASGGARVVISGNNRLFPPSLLKFQERTNLTFEQFADRRHRVQRLRGLNDTSYLKYVNWTRCDLDDWQPSCSKTYKFGQAGVVVGTAGALLDGFLAILDLPEEDAFSRFRDREAGWDDQAAWNALILRAPGMVTIDYTGGLAMTVSPAHLTTVLEVVGGEVRNTVTGATQCYIHGPHVEDCHVARDYSTSINQQPMLHRLC